MGGFSHQIGDPSSGGKFDSFLNQNKITTPTTSGQQQFGQPMQQSAQQPNATGGQPPSTQLDQSAATGQSAYPNTIGTMDNTQNQPAQASLQSGKGKGA